MKNKTPDEIKIVAKACSVILTEKSKAKHIYIGLFRLENKLFNKINK